MTTLNFDATQLTSTTLPEAESFREDSNAHIKHVVRAYQDAQRNRVSAANRLAQAGATLAGVDTTQKFDEDQSIGQYKEQVLTDYAVLMDQATEHQKTVGLTAKQFAKLVEKTDTVFGNIAPNRSFVVFAMTQNYLEVEALEARAYKQVERILKIVPIWSEFMEGVTGLGPAIAGEIIASIDIHRAQYPSSLWKLSGYDVARDGKGRSRKSEHLGEFDYIDTNGKPQRRKGLTFNPQLKTKLYLAAESFIKVGPERSPYAKVYYDTKHRLENHVKYGVKAQEAYEVASDKPEYRPSKGHRHNMAMRASIKRFLVDLYNAWRELEGLPVAPEYSQAKLGMTHGSAAKYA